MRAPGHPHIFPVQGGVLGAVSVSASLCAGEPRGEASSREVGMGQPLTLPPVFLPDPCQNHHCKHGKVCEVDDNNSPMCVCQDPSSCPATSGVFEKVRAGAG